MNNKFSKSSNDSANQSRLVGWLVSYALDELGFSYPIMAGKSFIGKANCNNHPTLTVNDKSIETPHFVIKANTKHQVFAEDILSDAGSYLQHEDETEERITGTVELKHGDWIRIGNNTKFQVCLIDGPTK